ncbi:hypothetical protein FGO68_gene4022 [Halteria grandinella]|uniref:Uncharacterized protein n=1 Tax=Halteria grandinella TaxID=5974 RepID=A0A8J8NQ37_HALGN|nr:hypothetical protein FGO68_gene4022 [Halteria grandinella]
MSSPMKAISGSQSWHCLMMQPIEGSWTEMQPESMISQFLSLYCESPSRILRSLRFGAVNLRLRLFDFSLLLFYLTSALGMQRKFKTTYSFLSIPLTKSWSWQIISGLCPQMEKYIPIEIPAKIERAVKADTKARFLFQHKMPLKN